MTAKLRLRQQKERNYSTLIHVDLILIQNAVSPISSPSAHPGGSAEPLVLLAYLLTRVFDQLRRNNVSVFPCKELPVPKEKPCVRPRARISWETAKKQVEQQLGQYHGTNETFANEKEE